MSKTILSTAAGLALLMASAAHAGPNLVKNGNFETGLNDTIPEWSQTKPEVNSLLINTGQNYQTYAGGSGSPAALANQFLSFGAGNSSDSAYITQSFTAAQTGLHHLAFDFGAFGGTQTLSFGLFDTNSLALVLSDVMSKGGTANLDTLFSTYGYDVNLTAGSNYTLRFSNYLSQTGSADALLDNVSLAAVPEPTTWAMMIGGLAVVGLSMRRRSVRANVQFA